MKRFLAMGSFIALALVFHLAGVAHGQTPVPSTDALAPSAKSRSWSRLDVVPSLIVMNARDANLLDQKLVLDGVGANAIIFADRPVRAAGHLLTSRLLEEWGNGGSFAKDPPNATVSVLSKDDASVSDVVVELRNPHLLQGDQLSFDVRVLEGNLVGANGPAAVFVDTIGLAFAPVSMLRPLD
jgi:hypothetical protein